MSRAWTDAKRIEQQPALLGAAATQHHAAQAQHREVALPKQRSPLAKSLRVRLWHQELHRKDSCATDFWQNNSWCEMLLLSRRKVEEITVEEWDGFDVNAKLSADTGS